MSIKEVRLTGLSWFWIAILIFVLDQYTKNLALHALILHESLKITPIFDFTLAFNKGAAFSFLHSASGWQNSFLGGIAAFISAILVYWLTHLSAHQIRLNVALSLIIGGAFGNIFDRIVYGYVIDFLDFHINVWHWPIFNIADSAVCIGTGLIIWDWWKNK